MNPKDRKHSNKDKPKTSAHGDREELHKLSNKTKKEISDKNRTLLDKDSELTRYKLNPYHTEEHEGDNRKEIKKAHRVNDYDDNYNSRKAKKPDKDYDKEPKARNRKERVDDLVEKRHHKKEVTDDGEERKHHKKENVDDREERKHHRKENTGDREERKHHRKENTGDREENRHRRKENENEIMAKSVKREKQKHEAIGNEHDTRIRSTDKKEDSSSRHYRLETAGMNNELSVRKREKPNDEVGTDYSKDQKDTDRLMEREKSKIKSDSDKDYRKEHRERKHKSDRESRDTTDKEPQEVSKEMEREKKFRKVSAEVVLEPTIEPNRNYDDDFDNYDDDDFEDDELELSPGSSEQAFSNSSSKTPVSDRMPQDNREPSLKFPGEPSVKSAVKIHSSFINFKIAQKKCSHDVVANKMLSRAYDLSRLIDLDRVTYDILEMAPIVKHSQYMKLFGKQGCQHEGVQTKDDNISREIQTETIEEKIVWTQHPALEDNGCVQVVYDSSGDRDERLQQIDTLEKTALETLSEAKATRSSLIQVLSLVENVLEEEASCDLKIKVTFSKDGKQPLSIGYNKYNNSSQQMECTMARFALQNSNIFATVQYSKINQTENANESRGKASVAIWRVSSTTGKPQMYLEIPTADDSKSVISSLTFSPDAGASHVTCGLTNGAIALWDLREYSPIKYGTRALPPAYLTTGFTAEEDDVHHGSIISIQPVTIGTNSSSYKLISLDSFAQLVIWIISPIAQGGQWNLESGSLSDLNLRPGAKYRMSRISTVSLASGQDFAQSFSFTCMTMDPDTSTNFFLGSYNGQIFQHVRATQTTSKTRLSLHKKILGESNSFESGAVTHLDYYPFFEPFVLAGYDDGFIRIFAVGKSNHLLSFCYKRNVPFLQIKWSRSHPAIFFSLDVEGNLCAWNVLSNIYQPVQVEHLPGYIGFDLSSDSKWQIKDKSSTNIKARLLLWALDGRIEVHDLSDAFSNPDLDASFKTCSLFQSML